MGRGRGAVATTAMGAGAAREQRRKAATENMVRGSLQSADAAATGTMITVNGTNANNNHAIIEGGEGVGQGTTLYLHSYQMI